MLGNFVTNAFVRQVQMGGRVLSNQQRGPRVDSFIDTGGDEARPGCDRFSCHGTFIVVLIEE